MSHTPGPWRVERDDDGSDRLNIMVGAGVLARLAYPFDDNAELDAALIAAAPDLLEACRCLCGWHCSESPTMARELAVKAIAKAEGKA